MPDPKASETGSRAPNRILLGIGAALLVALGAIFVLVLAPDDRPPPGQDMSEGRSGRALFNYAARGEGSITGVVRDPSGQPAAALVLVAPISLGEWAGAEALATFSAQADGSGRYAVNGLPEGAYAVSATSPAHSPAHAAPVRVAARGPSVVDLTLGPPGAALTGRVLDLGGGSIGGARLIAEWTRTGLPSHGAARVFAFTSDGEGRFRARLQKGHYRITVSADGYAPEVHMLDVTTDLEKTFALEPGGSLSGLVVTRADRQPAPEATVDLMATAARHAAADRGEIRQPIKIASTSSDQGGRFSFKSVPPGSYVLVARKGGLVAQRPGVFTVAAARETGGLEIQLGTGGKLSGRVLSAARRPLAGARVSATAVGYQPRTIYQADSDAEGRFVIEGIVPGPYVVRISAVDWGGYLKEHVLKGDLDLGEIALPGETTVSGTIRSQRDEVVRRASVTILNAPVRNARPVDIATSTVLSDDDGRFRVSGLLPGVVWVEAVSEEGRASFGPQPLGAGEHLPVKLVLGEGASIAGRVVVKDKGPAAGVLVRCKSIVLDRRVETDAAGNYRCDALSDGLYDVLVVRGPADHPWFLGLGRGLSASYGGKQVGLRRAEEKTGVDLEIRAEESSVSGSVVGADGQPVPGVAVLASREVFGASRRALNDRGVDARALTNAEGAFTLTQLPEGHFRVWAETYDGATAKLEHVAAGARDVVLRLRGTARVAGVVVDDQGKPVSAYVIRALARRGDGHSYEEVVERTEGPPLALQTTYDEDGRFVIPSLREGNHELVVNTSDGKFGRLAVEGLKPGENREGLRITLGGGASVRGKLIEHATGAPVARCRVTVDVGDRTVTAISDEQGGFALTGLVAGDDLAVRLHANGFIDDERLIETAPGKPDTDLGVIRLVRGTWAGRRPAPFPGWVLEGHLTHTAVAAVMPDGIAQRAGVLPGTIIVGVNDQDARNLGPYSVMFLASSENKDGATTPPRLRVRLPDGSERELVLVKPPSG